MSTRIRAHVVVDRRVDYRHAQGQSDGMLMDLSLQGCQIKGAPPSRVGRACGCNSGFPARRSPWQLSRQSCDGSRPINVG